MLHLVAPFNYSGSRKRADCGVKALGGGLAAAERTCDSNGGWRMGCNHGPSIHTLVRLFISRTHPCCRASSYSLPLPFPTLSAPFAACLASAVSD